MSVEMCTVFVPCCFTPFTPDGCRMRSTQLNESGSGIPKSPPSPPPWCIRANTITAGTGIACCFSTGLSPHSHHSHTFPQPHTQHTPFSRRRYIKSIGYVHQQEGVMRGARLLMRSVHPLYAQCLKGAWKRRRCSAWPHVHQHTVVDSRHTMVQPSAEGWCAAPTTCCFTSSAPPIAGFAQTHDRCAKGAPPPERCHHHITSTIPPHQQESTNRTPANAERPPTRPPVLPQGDLKRGGCCKLTK